jgi:hypothetical protein
MSHPARKNARVVTSTGGGARADNDSPEGLIGHDPFLDRGADAAQGRSYGAGLRRQATGEFRLWIDHARLIARQHRR